MANPKSRVLPQIIDVFIFVFFAHCVDLFFQNLSGDTSVLVTNLYGHAVGILCVFVACIVKRKDIRYFGLDFRLKKILKGLLVGAAFSLIPILITFILQLGVYSITQFEDIKPQFNPPNITITKYSKGASFLVFGLAALVSTFLKEYFFRGYILKSARPTYSFADANIIQSVLYISFSISVVFKNIFYGKYGAFGDWFKFYIILILFYIVNDFFCAIKLGLITRVSGNIWPAFFLSYFYRFFAYSIFSPQTKITRISAIILLLVSEAMSFIMVWFYYKREMEKREQKKLEKRLRRIEQKDKAFSSDAHESYYGGESKIDRHNADKLEDYSFDTSKSQVNDYAESKPHHRHHHHHRHRHTHSRDEHSQNSDVVSVNQNSIADFKNSHKTEFIAAIGHHTHHRKTDKDDDKLMRVDELDINNFYKEHVKALEQGLEAEAKKLKEEIESLEKQNKKSN